MASVQEYLATDFEADREYVDGELIERHSGEQPHSRAQAMISSLLLQREPRSGTLTLISQRVQVSPTRFCVPDVCVLMAPDPRDPVVRNAPFRYVWVLDPETERAFCYTPGEMHEISDGVLRTKNPDIEVPLANVFEA